MRPRHTLAVALLCATSLSSLAFAHGGHGSALPVEACASKALGEVCSFENQQHTQHRGTCRSMSGALRCVRSQPIETPAPDPAPPPKSDSSTAPMAAGLFGLIAAIGWTTRRRKPSQRQ